MKQIIINKEIENEVESMVLLGKQFSDLKRSYPECEAILRKQFNMKDFPDTDYIPDDFENVKISLYAAIIRQHNKERAKKEQDIAKKLK